MALPSPNNSCAAPGTKLAASPKPSEPLTTVANLADASEPTCTPVASPIAFAFAEPVPPPAAIPAIDDACCNTPKLPPILDKAPSPSTKEGANDLALDVTSSDVALTLGNVDATVALIACGASTVALNTGILLPEVICGSDCTIDSLSFNADACALTSIFGKFSAAVCCALANAAEG